MAFGRNKLPIIGSNIGPMPDLKHDSLRYLLAELKNEIGTKSEPYFQVSTILSQQGSNPLNIQILSYRASLF